MYEVGSSSICPVKLYEFYTEKLHPDNPNWFAKSKKSFVKGDQTWYTNEVIGKNLLVNIMKQISNKAGLSKTYTNHCVRASTVTNLYQAGIDTQQICSITKHKNESTLSHYISSTSDEQKMKASHILSKPFIVPESVETTSNESQLEAQVLLTNETNERSRSAQLIQSVMPNGVFKNYITQQTK
ncbi:MAG: tyrosine-type recombinase/integrase [Cyanobacteria bacterium J06649_11]